MLRFIGEPDEQTVTDPADGGGGTILCPRKTGIRARDAAASYLGNANAVSVSLTMGVPT